MIRSKQFAFNSLLLIFLSSLLYITFTILTSGKNGSETPSSFREDEVEWNYNQLELTKRIREVKGDVTQLWFYLKSELKAIKNEKRPAVIAKWANQTMARTAEHKNAILRGIDLAMEVDADWRMEQFTELSHLLQKRLQIQQNPRNCDPVKKILCDFNIKCGFGCTVHHLMYCLMMAYGMKRTLILDYRGKGFADEWNSWFEPISSCQYHSKMSAVEWNDQALDEHHILRLSTFPKLRNRPDFSPTAIPKEFSPILSRLHGNPFAWWAGQFLKFIMTPKKELETVIEKTKRRFKFLNPIVGIQVRRTDKLVKEGTLHNLSEYMGHADEYFAQRDLRYLNTTTRRIYLATDDPKVFQEAKKNFKKYQFIGDPKISESASPKKRNSKESVLGIILDTYFLSQSDFIICTFSSNVGRLVYSMMQSVHPVDVSTNYRSLENVYYFHNWGQDDFQAIYSHKAVNKLEVDFNVGDLITVIDNHLNGYINGTVKRTKKIGIFPSFKIRRVVRESDYGKYS